MSATTYEWLGEPQASASVKKVDGVEVARNLMPGFMGWSNIDQEAIEVLSAAHIAAHEPSGSTIGVQGFPVAEPGALISISYEARTTSPGPGREDGRAYLLNTFSGFVTRNGRGVSFPADGEWHWTASTQAVEDLDWSFLFRFGGQVSPSFEVRNVFAWAIADGDRPDFFNGDTPDHSISAFKVRHKPVVTHEWAGEPHASESIKRVDGVEVARNLVPGFGAWVSDSNSEVIAGGHIRLMGGDAILPGSLAVPVAEGANSVQWYVQARTTHLSNNDSHAEDGDAAAHANVYDDTDRAGTAQRFPADGEWHDVSFTMSLDAGATSTRLRLQSDTTFSSPEYEVREVRYGFNSVEPDEYFDGDTPSYKLDGEWRLVPTLVCKGGAFQHASIKKYAEGEYRSA